MPSSFAAFACGVPSRPTGHTIVVSIANCAPLNNGKPFAITSSLHPSVTFATPKLRSRRNALNWTRAPPSRQTRAIADSRGKPRLDKTPQTAQAARWSPLESRKRRHRHKRWHKGKSTRNLRNNKTRKDWDLILSSLEVGTIVKAIPLPLPPCDLM